MSLGAPDVPTAPSAPTNSLLDPYSLAAQQQAYNIGSGVMSQAGSLMPTNTPNYSTQYTQVGTGPGGVPIYGINQTLSPQQQQLYDQYTANQGQAGNYMSQLMTEGQNMLAGAGSMYGQGQDLLQAGQVPLQQSLNTLGGYSLPAFQQAQGTLSNNATPAVGQAQNTFSNLATPAFQQAQGQFSNLANPAFAQAQSQFGNVANPAFGQAGNYIAAGLNPLAQASGHYDQAGNWVDTYAGQNPSQIGDMAQGLTGQRMDAAVAGIKPFQDTQRDQLDTKLKNQGLHPGQPAYDNALRELDYSQNMAISSFEAQFQPQSWQQASQIYQDPLTKANAYMGLGQANVGQAGAFGQLGSAQTGVGQGYTGVGQGYLGAGQGYTGVGQGYLGAGTGLTGVGQGQLGAAGAYTGIAGGQTAAGQGYNQLAQGQAGVGAQYGAYANTMANMANSWGNQGLQSQAQALPWLAASAPTMPGAPTPTPLNVQPSNIAGLGSAYNNSLTSQYQNQLSAYNAQLAQQQNTLSGLFGLGSSALGALGSGAFLSERHLKENINRIGTLKNGLPVYEFNYKWGGPTLIGLMVDEVERIRPEAVIYADGFKLVNYERAAA